VRRVAITGVGIVSCLGSDRETVSAALRHGASGIVSDPERTSLGFRSPLTGRIQGFDPAGRLSRKQRKSMPEFAVQAHAAAMDALAQAGLGPKDIENEQTGLVFGCDSSCEAVVEAADSLRRGRDTRLIGSGPVFKAMNSTITLNLNAILRTRGASWTVSGACASGAHAMGQAADLIMLGRQERVICGGAQEISWQAMAAFDAIGAFSLRLAEPQAASRPFDAGRDGLVPSGGAAALVLERYDLALARGAAVLGEVAGYGFSSDGSNLAVPSGEGLARSMAAALAAAGLAPADIDQVSAHATSTPLGDAAEAKALCAVFGRHRPYVSALKSMTGHELWMSGASQAVYAVLMAAGGFIAPTINLDAPDGHAAGLNILTVCLPRPPRNALLNAAGFGGTNASLVLRFGP